MSCKVDNRVVGGSPKGLHTTTVTKAVQRMSSCQCRTRLLQWLPDYSITFIDFFLVFLCTVNTTRSLLLYIAHVSIISYSTISIYLMTENVLMLSFLFAREYVKSLFSAAISIEASGTFLCCLQMYFRHK